MPTDKRSRDGRLIEAIVFGVYVAVLASLVVAGVFGFAHMVDFMGSMAR